MERLRVLNALRGDNNFSIYLDYLRELKYNAYKNLLQAENKERLSGFVEGITACISYVETERLILLENQSLFEQEQTEMNNAEEESMISILKNKSNIL